MPITMFAKDWSAYRIDKFLSLRAKNPFRCFELMDKFDQFVTSFADLDFNGDPCCYFEVVNENTNILMSPIRSIPTNSNGWEILTRKTYLH